MKKSHYYQAIVKLLVISSFIHTVIAAADENNLIKQQLIAQVEHYVMTERNPDNDKMIQIAVMPIDKRIHVPFCSSPLTLSASEKSLRQSTITVKARCNENNWYMFVVVKATETQQVVIISSAVSPGTLLTKNNLSVANMDKKRLRSSTFADIEQVIGARIKRRVMAGRPVESNNLCYVCKGDSIVISAGSPSMRVKTSGIALEDGNIGQTIQVKNTRSSKKIQARVASTGKVEISI